MNPHHDFIEMGVREATPAGCRGSFTELALRAVADTRTANERRAVLALIYAMRNNFMPPAYDRDMGVYQIQCQLDAALRAIEIGEGR